MFCKKCGKEIPNDVKFCPACGDQTGAEAAVQAEAAPAAQTVQAETAPIVGNAPQSGTIPPAAATQQPVAGATPDAQSDNIAILCYFGLFFLIPLFTRPDSKFCKFHCNQGLLLL